MADPNVYSRLAGFQDFVPGSSDVVSSYGASNRKRSRKARIELLPTWGNPMRVEEARVLGHLNLQCDHGTCEEFPVTSLSDVGFAYRIPGIGPILKRVNQIVSDTGSTSRVYPGLIGPIARGSAPTALQRSGSKVGLIGVALWGALETWVVTNLQRLVPWSVCLVYDKHPTDAVPALAEMYTDDFLNPENQSRFVEIRRFNITLCPSQGTQTRAAIAAFVNLQMLPRTFSGETSALADVSSGALYLVVLKPSLTLIETADSRLALSVTTFFYDH